MRTFNEAVGRLRELDDTSTLTALEVGDIALEQAPVGVDRTNNGSIEIMQRLSDESGVPLDTLQERRQVAARIPLTARAVSVSYSVYREIAWRPTADERTQLLEMIQAEAAPTPSGRWTVDAIRTFVGKRPTRFPTPTDIAPVEPPPYEDLRDQIDVASDEAKQFAFRRLAGDPAVLAEAVEIGSPVSQAVTSLERKADLLREQRRERAVQADPVAVRLEQQTAAVDIAGECNRYRRDTRRFAEAIEHLLPNVGTVEEGDLFWIREAVSDAQAALDRLARLMDTGQTDLNTFLDRVLTGERDAQH